MPSLDYNNKRIAKNTLLLYIRMLLLMVISLYTSRVVLSSLGIEDYGIYNIVGGVVVFLGFLNGTLSSASARFINVSLSKRDVLDTQRTFTTLFWVTIVLALIIVLLSETIGLWFILEKVQYPLERKSAVIVVYHISVITTLVNVACIPYNAMIIAQEKMKAYAYISLFDAFAKLFIAFIIGLSIPFDKLVFYALLIAILQLMDSLIYVCFCKMSFSEAKLSLFFDKRLFKEILHYVGWSSYGSFASVGFTQGVNIVLNLFFGPAVNAARAVANQVSHACLSFANNFQIAVNPQLTKSVAIRDFTRSKFLVYASSRFSFFLMCLLCVPLIGEAGFVLDLWLEDVPEHSVSFVQIMLLISIVQCLAFSLRTANQAEGNIKRFQLFECTLLLMIVPISYLGLLLGFRPEFVFITHLVIESIAQIVRIVIVTPKIQMTFQEYAKNVYMIVLPILFLALLVTIVIQKVFPSSIFRFILNVTLTESVLLFSILFYGMNKAERLKINQLVQSKIRHKG